jgi:hypothetical protein
MTEARRHGAQDRFAGQTVLYHVGIFNVGLYKFKRLIAADSVFQCSLLS